MGGIRILALGIAALAVSAVTQGPAAAQCRLCETPTTTISEGAAGDDIKLEVESSLNFDRLILFGQGEGAAVIRPDGSTASTGAVTGMSPRAMVATVVVHGQPGRAVRVDLPRRVQLFSLGGGQISFDELESDLPSMPRLDSSGNLTFRFGGRVRLTGDAEGDYRGDLSVTVEYQ